MKKLCALSVALVALLQTNGQTVVINQTPCTDKNVQTLPALYYDHTKPKYGGKMIVPGGGYTAGDVTRVFATLNQIEKLEENSRKNFQAMGCVMRVSYSRNSNNIINGILRKAYSYNLGLYQMVCHVQQHVVKEVGEYRSVVRVTANPAFDHSPLNAGTGGLVFNKAPGTLFWTYDFPADAKLGPGYENDRANNPGRISKYFSEQSVLQGRSDNYKDYHGDFLKINNGDGYVENWMAGSRYDVHTEKSYKWIDRHYLITKPGIPLLVPVSRKQYLQDMLEYLEIEKANFNTVIEELIKKAAADNSDFANQKRATWQAHKTAYAEIYEARKAILKELLATKGNDWLQQQAIVAGGIKTHEAHDRLKETGKFYDKESENIFGLYALNPVYWNRNATDPLKPVLFEIQFRYEDGEERQWSANLVNNFAKNFDFAALRKMLE